MDEIKWLEVAINTTPERLDEITAKLTAAGMTGLVIEDEAEFQQFLEQNRQYWDYVDEDLRQEMQGRSRITFYLEAGDEGLRQAGGGPHRPGGAEKDPGRLRHPADDPG